MSSSLCVRDLERFFVYHSPQYPGFTSWCGLWTMSDASVMCSFTQATGPFQGRPRAPDEVRRRLAWPPAGREAYDMTGLRLENVHLRSADSGRSWAIAGTDAFTSCMNGAFGEAEVALADGTILRGGWGQYLPYDEDVPRDGFVQRSGDGGRTWGVPEPINADDACTFWPKRLRVLDDGRLLAGGGLHRRFPGQDTRTDWGRDALPVLFVADAAGYGWSGPFPVVAEAQREGFDYTEEFDWAECPGGDLLVIVRAGQKEGRLQVRLRKAGDGWEAGSVAPAGLPYSGHPELLAMTEGTVLHVATTGISATCDEGATWQDLRLQDGLAELRDERATPYYPKSVQLGDGEIVVIGHVGGDDGYGKVDQSIIGLRFRLEG